MPRNPPPNSGVERFVQLVIHRQNWLFFRAGAILGGFVIMRPAGDRKLGRKPPYIRKGTYKAGEGPTKVHEVPIVPVPTLIKNPNTKIDMARRAFLTGST